MRIQLISETSLIRQGLICMLAHEHSFHIAPAVTCSPPHCYQACYSPENDVTVMDAASGKNACIDCIRQISKRHPDIKILAIIWPQNFTQLNEAIHNGAIGVLSMDADKHLFKQAISSVAEGKQFIDPNLKKAMSDAPFRHAINPFDTLSPREKTVTTLILKGNGTAACAERLHVSQKTVANHYTRIKKKLAVDNLGQLTRLAIRHNLIKA